MPIPYSYQIPYLGYPKWYPKKTMPAQTQSRRDKEANAPSMREVQLVTRANLGDWNIFM
jgi:hypothetical protein